MVYIAEAHAADEWPVGGSIVVDQPRSLEARRQACKQFCDMFQLQDTPLKVMIDNPENGDGVDAEFALWPTRFYVIEGGEVRLKAEPSSEHEYSLDVISHFLQNRFPSAEGEEEAS